MLAVNIRGDVAVTVARTPHLSQKYRFFGQGSFSHYSATGRYKRA